MAGKTELSKTPKEEEKERLKEKERRKNGIAILELEDRISVIETMLWQCCTSINLLLEKGVITHEEISEAAAKTAKYIKDQHEEGAK